MSVESLVEADARCLWHPYAPASPSFAPVPIASAKGVWLSTVAGQELIDGMSSWWAVCHGHGHPHLQEAAHRQIETMSHVMFGGLTHKPAVQLAERLLTLNPGLARVFFSDSGSVSVEVALKMALQYQRGLGHPERTRLLTWRSGYHGDTFGAMSVCDPEGGMHSLWSGVLARQKFAPPPPVRGSGAEAREAYLAKLEHEIDETIAGVIIEPVVQGAGGMRFHDDELVIGVRDFCDRHGLLMIVDEIATGFGRTGELFVTRGAGIVPDILCLGKALTGGFMSFAATLVAEHVADVISTPAAGGALMHGPTFMANPLACAVAGAAVELAESGYWQESVPSIESRLRAGLAPLSGHEGVADVRVLGAIGVVEMREDVDMERATRAAVEAGVWLRPFGRLIYCMPPFVSTDAEVDAICAAISAVVQATAGGAAQ